MPIREGSFRIGCGRYVQEAGALCRCGDEVKRLGSAPLIIGGKTALSLTRDKIESSIKACKKYELITHSGSCNEQDATELAAYSHKNGFDVIVGVGGGVIMDFAKLIANIAGLPIINIPTSSATCAAYTPLSVCYTKDGRTVGTRHFEREVDAVLADSAVLGAQPTRLLLAGVFDALAKFVEIKHRYSDDGCPLGLDYAYVLSQRSFSELSQKTEKCIADMEGGQITDTVEQVIFTTLAATGVISGIARGSNQCALAHKFYETARAKFYTQAKPYLHGEIVGVGLLLQNCFNSETQKNGALLDIMKKHGMPHSVRGVGIEQTSDTFDVFFESIKNSSAVEPATEQKFKDSLLFLWQL